MTDPELEHRADFHSLFPDLESAARFQAEVLSRSLIHELPACAQAVILGEAAHSATFWRWMISEAIGEQRTVDDWDRVWAEERAAVRDPHLHRPPARVVMEPHQTMPVWLHTISRILRLGRGR